MTEQKQILKQNGHTLVAIRSTRKLPDRFITEVSLTKTGRLVAHYDDGKQKIIGTLSNPGVSDIRLMHSGKLVLELTDGTRKIVGPIRGANGVDGTDGSGFVWRGSYQSNVIYYGVDDNPNGPFADVVEFEGSTYVATGRTTAPPPKGTWELMAAKGDNAQQVVYLGGGGGGIGEGGEVDLTPFVRRDGTISFTGQITVPNGTSATKAVNRGQLDVVAADVSIVFGQASSAQAAADAAQTTADAAMPKAGGTFIGNINVPTATDSMHAVAKYQLDSAVPAVSVVPGAPLAPTGTSGASSAYARADHVHPYQPSPLYNLVDSVPILNVRRLTTAEYAALSPPDPNTLYAVVPNS